MLPGLVAAEEKYSSFAFEDEEEAAEYYFLREQLQMEKEKLIPFIQKSKNIAGFLVRGRMIKVTIFVLLKIVNKLDFQEICMYLKLWPY